MFEKLEDIRRKYDEVKARLADPAFVQDHRAVRQAQKALAEFEPIIRKTEEHRQVSRELEGARELMESLSPGDELYQMAATERASRVSVRSTGAGPASAVATGRPVLPGSTSTAYGPNALIRSHRGTPAGSAGSTHVAPSS